MNTNDVKSILLAGVGGQGILRASDIICMAVMEAGFDTKKSEVHGMAQRGGCVTSHVRYGAKVYSPLARKGDVDILLSFEKLETLRYLDFLKPDGIIIMDKEEIYPPAVNLGISEYPRDILEQLKDNFKNVVVADALALAREAGNLRAANTVMLGIVSKYIDIKDEIWESVLRRSFPEKLVDLNIKAFRLGKEDS
ncbi:MAG: indolepyruvate oxidoreductase subunit beta [Syntrophaceae bacterium]